MTQTTIGANDLQPMASYSHDGELDLRRTDVAEFSWKQIPIYFRPIHAGRKDRRGGDVF